MVFWNPERGKSEAIKKLSAEQNFHEVQFNPNSESLIVSLLGDKSFKFFELKQTEEKTIEIEELEESIDAALTEKYVLRSHVYLSSSQQIAILAENEIILLDYQGRIQDVIPIRAECVTNWGEGFLISQ